MNVKDNSGSTALHLAAWNGKLEVVQYLLEKGGAEVNVKNNSGSTALHWAADKGHLEMVKYLFEKGGAEVNVKNDNGITALDLARTMVIRNLLIKRGNLLFYQMWTELFKKVIFFEC